MLKPPSPLRPALFGAALLLAGLAAWQLRERPSAALLERRPIGIMGTTSTLAALVDSAAPREEAEVALTAAEAELRRIEALMSNWLDDSEVTRFNRAAAGQLVAFTVETQEVLAAARRFHALSDGAFDVTLRPLLELWQRAGSTQVPPSDEAIAAARRASTWEAIELLPQGAGKRLASAAVDLGGIAKGYGVDRALALLRRGGVRGGLVEVGGDLAVWGRSPNGEAWPVALRDPRADAVWGELRLRDRAVATSGNYARFVTIDGHRFSHIVDPRDGRPADRAASVTVVAREAIAADAWATALSVLGPAGLAGLPAEERLEALLIFEEDGALLARTTPGFAALVHQASPDLAALLAGRRLAARGAAAN